MVHHGEFVIPDFQRDVVWQTPQVAALWDSVYRGFPIGSLLYWTTGERLASLRSIGGFALADTDAALNQFGSLRYVLDGQQRLTAFFIAMKGGKKSVKSDLEVNYALYFDPTAGLIPSSPSRTASSDRDETSPYAARYFLFAGERDRRATELKKAGVSPKLIVRLDKTAVVSEAARETLALEAGFTEEIGQNLARLQKTLLEYRVPVVSVSNASAEDVSQIFQRVNRSGTELTVFDIAVARAFRAGSHGGQAAFSLRTAVDHIKQELKTRSHAWARTDNLDLLRMIAYCLRVLQNHGELQGNPRISAEQADLPSIGAHDISRVWDRVESAIFRAITFFISQGVYKPDMLASGYLPLPICAHLLDHNYQPDAAEWTQISRWFWRHAFDRQSIKDQGAADRAMRDVFGALTPGTKLHFDALKLSADELVRTRNSHSARYLATWAFLTYLGPLDFATGQPVALDRKNRWKRRTGNPSRHHIYPIAFLDRLHPGLDAQSVMNVAIISAKTNMGLQDASPIAYLPDLQQALEERRPPQDIGDVMASHLIPMEYFRRSEVTAEDYRAFLAERAQRLIKQLGKEFDITIESN